MSANSSCAVSSDEENRSACQPRKKGRGRPRKKGAISDAAVTLSDVDGLFREVEKRLKSTISNLIAEALVPLHSLATDKLEAFANKLQNLEYELRQRIDKLDAEFERVSANPFSTNAVAIAD